MSTEPSPLAELLARVNDRASFFAFVRALAADRRDEDQRGAQVVSPFGPGANGWESHSIETFLEAALSWGEDVSEATDERREWFPERPSFQAFARFLYM